MIHITQCLAATDVEISKLYNPAPKIPAATATLADLITKSGFNLLDLVFFAVGLGFLTNLIMAGWDYMLSSGDPKKITAASSRITNGIIGLIMSFSAFVLVRTVANLLGIKTIF